MRKPRKKGKKIRKVEVRACGKLYKLDLRLLDTSESYSSKPSFDYIIDEDEPCPIYVKDHDVDECIAKAQKVIAERLAIEWRDVLHVSVESIESGHRSREPEDDVRDEDDYALTLEWKAKQVGERGGEPVYRDRPGSSQVYPGTLDEGTPSHQPHWERTKQYAIIDDTPANREALQKVADGLVLLAAKVRELFGPKAIQLTLANLKQSLPMLAAPTTVEVKPLRLSKKKRTGKKATKKKAVRRKARGSK